MHHGARWVGADGRGLDRTPCLSTCDVLDMGDAGGCMWEGVKLMSNLWSAEIYRYGRHRKHKDSATDRQLNFKDTEHVWQASLWRKYFIKAY